MSTVLELYEMLKPKLGEVEARELLEFVGTRVEQRVATKEDLERAFSGLREDCRRTASGLREDFRRTRVEELPGLCAFDHLRGDLAGVRKDIQDFKVEYLMWSFALWVGFIVAISGMMFLMLPR